MKNPILPLNTSVPFTIEVEIGAKYLLYTSDHYGKIVLFDRKPRIWMWCDNTNAILVRIESPTSVCRAQNPLYRDGDTWMVGDKVYANLQTLPIRNNKQYFIRKMK